MTKPFQLPLLPLRDIVAFPMMTLPIWVGRARSFKACEDALAGDGRILLVAQKDPTVENPTLADLFGIGVVAAITEHVPLADGRMKLIVRGERRARISNAIDDPNRFLAMVEPIDGTIAETPSFDRSDAKSENRVPDLQRILEDGALSAAERLHAATALISGG
jgi:ATP-dependent Lon protease